MTETLQSNNNKQTGTRPKSRSSTNVLRNPSFGSWLGSHQALVTLPLMRELQAVSDSLAVAREQIKREGHQDHQSRQQAQQPGPGHATHHEYPQQLQ